MKKNLVLTLLLILFFAIILNAQETVAPLEAKIVIEVTAFDNNLAPKSNKKRNVILNVTTLGSNFLIAPSKTYTFNLSIEKPFKIVLPSTTNFTYVNFEFDEVVDRSSINNVYIFEKGDSVNCKVSEKSYEFYGKGAEKLNCQSEMYDIRYRPSKNDVKLLNDKQYQDYFEARNKIADSIFEKQLGVVNKYAVKLGKKMTEIMLANAYGNRYASNLNSLIMSRLSDPGLLPAFLESEAYQNIDLTLNQKLEPAILIASPNYCNFLLEKISLDNLIESKSKKLRSNIEMPGLVFNTIKKNYEGLLREKLLAMFFLKYKDYSESYHYLDEAMQFVESNEIVSILLNIKNTKAKGSTFFPFELENTKGAITRLSDLNGKVVVLDFWYSGCGNCVILHEGMKPVVEKFKNNPKVEFVSVSIDEDKFLWLKSVASGKYADPNGLNLYTNGLGYYHPLIEKYYVRSYPAIFVLKNGKLISASPPRPGPSFTLPDHIEARVAFISLIEEALNDNSILP